MQISSALARLSMLAFRSLRRGLAWAEPQDVGFVTARLDRGDIVWRAFRDAGVALMDAGRFDEADLMLSRGLAVFPQDPIFSVAYAMSAHNSGRYPIAVERWEAALAAGSTDPLCHSCLAADFQALSDFDRAQAAIDEGLRRAPDDLITISVAAQVAVARNRFADALVFWQKAVASPKPHPLWLQGHAQTLLRLGELAEAEAAVKAARIDFPDHAGLHSVECALAMAREDWPTAIAQWTDYRRLRPDDPTGWQQLGIAIQASTMSAAADPVGPDEFRAVLPATIEVVDDEPLRRLMLRFESIGDNCELGLVQRRYAAEPLGLLRWNTVAYECLRTALEQRFDGMGEEQNTEISVAPNGEFYMQDRRWFLGMHTFLYAGQTDKDALYTKMCRRIVFLRDKLLDDLAAADKIFVYRSPGVGIDRVEELYHALRTFGPVTLLAVQPIGGVSDFTGAPGDILQVGDGRYVGFLSRAGVDRHGNWDIAFDDWTAICRKVDAAKQ